MCYKCTDPIDFYDNHPDAPEMHVEPLEKMDLLMIFLLIMAMIFPAAMLASLLWNYA